MRAIVLLAAAAAACAPNIEHFGAQPTGICPGDEVTLSWRVTGAEHNEAGLITDAASAVANQRTVRAEDSTRVSPNGDIVYRLVAGNQQGGVSADTRVNVLAAGNPALRFSFEQTLSCDTGFPDTVTFVPERIASPRLRVAAITPRIDRGVALVNLGGPLPGEPVGDPWVLHLDYPRPVCPPPGTVRPGTPPPPPKVVRFEVVAECG